MAEKLRIVHILRAPLGGLFRHVCDLIRAQSALGLDVGLICDASLASQATERMLTLLTEHCTLGVRRFPMSRALGPRDLSAYVSIQQYLARLKPDVVHGHGAKGGAYARLASNALKRWQKQVRTFYTPHGGSLHYSSLSIKGRIYLGLERQLGAYTDGLIFESEYSRNIYNKKVGRSRCPSKVIPNGLAPAEFYTYRMHDTAVEFVFVGELRRLKGVDVLLKALAQLGPNQAAKAVIIGSGPDEVRFKRDAKRLKLLDRVTFAGAKPARQAFAQGQCLVMPSRAESLPYIVLEAAAAQIPIILTNVGGIPEIVGDTGTVMVAPDDVAALRDQMRAFLAKPEPFLQRAEALQARVKEQFSLQKMSDDILDFYRQQSPNPRTATKTPAQTTIIAPAQA